MVRSASSTTALKLSPLRRNSLATVSSIRNKVEAAYACSDLFERRLMDDWSAYLAR